MSAHTSNPAGSPKVTDTTPRPSANEPNPEFQRFEDLARKLVKVPKGELDEKRRTI